jgi:peptidoglycan/xylan/chitin deacetylase (PgdA/CDA1 family)
MTIVVNDVFKKALFQSAELFGYYNIAKRRRKGATVLCYHGVEEIISDQSVQYIQTPLRLFEKQLKYLRKHFEFISIDYLSDCLTNGYTLHPSQILITFDDGYKNNLVTAAPLLRGYDIPFTVFVTTNNVDKGIRFPAYFLHVGIFYTSRDFFHCKSINKKYDISTSERRRLANEDLLKRMKTSPQTEVNTLLDELFHLMPAGRWDEMNNVFRSEEPLNWADLKKMKNMGVTIASHCHDHAILHELQVREEIEYQLRTSKTLLEKHLGECKYFAYPNGRVDDISLSAVDEVVKCKFRMAFTTIPGRVENDSCPFILPRISGGVNLETLKFYLYSGISYKDKYNRFVNRFDLYDNRRQVKLH